MNGSNCDVDAAAAAARNCDVDAAAAAAARNCDVDAAAAAAASNCDVDAAAAAARNCDVDAAAAAARNCDVDAAAAARNCDVDAAADRSRSSSSCSSGGGSISAEQSTMLLSFSKQVRSMLRLENRMILAGLVLGSQLSLDAAALVWRFLVEAEQSGGPAWEEDVPLQVVLLLQEAQGMQQAAVQHFQSLYLLHEEVLMAKKSGVTCVKMRHDTSSSSRSSSSSNARVSRKTERA